MRLTSWDALRVNVCERGAWVRDHVSEAVRSMQGGDRRGRQVHFLLALGVYYDVGSTHIISYMLMGLTHK